MGAGALFSIYQGRKDLSSLKLSILHAFLLILAVTLVLNLAVYAGIDVYKRQALYIVLVPVCGLFLRKRVQPKVWLAVLIAVAGLYLLCMTDGSFSLQKGDLLVLACALGFTIHILVIDHFSPLVDGIKMSCIQFFTCSILSAVCMAVSYTHLIGLLIPNFAA